LKLLKVDGMELLKEIKSDPRTKTIPVVIMTSSKEERDLVASYNLGANSYIQKPVDFDQFRDGQERGTVLAGHQSAGSDQWRARKGSAAVSCGFGAMLPRFAAMLPSFARRPDEGVRAYVGLGPEPS
jgi:CheY-like chemotaxis protein